MNYMVISSCTIIFLLIANSLLVFCEKYPLYFDFTMLCSLKVRGWDLYFLIRIKSNVLALIFPGTLITPPMHEGIR